MSDKSLGSIIFAVGFICAVVYAFWLFWPAASSDFLFYLPGVGRWAIVLPLFVAVIAVFLIAMWIGWTMAVTPPPPAILNEKSEKNVDEKI